MKLTTLTDELTILAWLKLSHADKMFEKSLV